MSATQTIAGVLRWLESSAGDEEAVADADGRHWSFADLGDHCRRACAAYADADVAALRPGERVSWLALGSSAPLLTVSLGLRKLGAVPVVVNSRASTERIAWMLEHAGVRAVAYSGECAELAEKVRSLGAGGVRRWVALDPRAALPGDPDLPSLFERHAGAPEPAVESGDGDPCLISYTSGTTGQPKAIVHREEEWSWTSFVMAYVLGLTHADVAMIAMPPAFIGWAHATSAALRAGAKQVVQRFEPAGFLARARAELGTHALLSPTLIRMLRASLRADPSARPVESLRICLVGGEPVTGDVIEAVHELFPNARRVNSLGSTEAVLLHSGSASDYLDTHPTAIGRPVPGMDLELRDEESDEVIRQSGCPGVLYARGPGVAAGVLDDDEATARNFPGGWWRSGDILVRDEHGWYGFVGRADHMFKSGSIKVFAEDVEQRLKSHPAVLDAVVIPVADATFGTVGFAHVRHDAPLSAEALESWWREQGFEGFSRPKHWRLWGMESFPMLTDAKVDRRSLAALAEPAPGGEQ